MALFSPYKTIRSALHIKSEATKRWRDRKENGKCTNATNRRSRVGLSTPFYTPKPVGKTAKTSFFARRAITACSCSFFSLIPPNFTSHTRCMISAILYSFVYYNFARAEAHQSTIRGSRLLHSPLVCHACRHAHFPYGFSSKRETARSLPYKLLYSVVHGRCRVFSLVFWLGICVEVDAGVEFGLGNKLLGVEWIMWEQTCNWTLTRAETFSSVKTRLMSSTPSACLYIRELA